MVGTSGVGGAYAPQVLCKHEHKNKEEDPGHLKKHNGAHPVEGPQKAADSACKSFGCTARGLPSNPAYGHLRSARRWSRARNALAGHAPGHTHSHAQYAPDCLRSHSDMMVPATVAPVLCTGFPALGSCLFCAAAVRYKNPTPLPALPRALAAALEVPLTSRLRELIQQLGEAIHESVIESEQIAGVVQDIRRHGFDVLLMLEATIGLNEVTDKDADEQEDSAEAGAAGPFTRNDVNFLRSLRISVEGEGDSEADKTDESSES